jgi:hypothetical protein
MPKTDTTPKALKPYLFHGVDLDWEGRKEAIGECPWCANPRFGVTIEEGLYNCRACGKGNDKGGGNALVMIRRIHEASMNAPSGATELAKDRRLLYPETVSAWGGVRSISTRDFILPGYDAEGRLCQLYRYLKVGGRMTLLPTPTLHHGLHGPRDGLKQTVWVCEGPWDGMALWEVMGRTKTNADGTYSATSNAGASLLSENSVLAVPGCSTFRDEWVPLLKDKIVVLAYDSDHPKDGGGKPGYDGMRRVAGLLAGTAQEIRYVQWGPEGYDRSLPDGTDVRDLLSGRPENTLHEALGARVARFQGLAGRVVGVPAPWLERKKIRVDEPSKRLEPAPCTEYRDLVTEWRKALRWRAVLDDVLSTMLAVSLSTDQIGDQLFCMVLGDAGSGKTRFCDGMLVSEGCYPLEHLTGFHSGWKDASGEDFSLIARINHKTLITPEGDVMMSSPRFAEIMSQQRRIFDGTSGASFKNMKEDLRYTGLRTPWIIAGTPALLDADQSRLGDRFLKVFIDPPSDDERNDILMRCGFSSLRSVKIRSDGTPESQLESSLCLAYQKTGGYVDWLRKNTDLLGHIECDEERLRYLARLAEFTADIRARPSEGKLEHHDTKELPSRLMHQFVRMACCLAVVLNRRNVDDEVLRRTRKVALDTGRGQTMDIVRHLAEAGTGGLEFSGLSRLLVRNEETTRKMLRFLRQIKVAELFTPNVQVAASGKMLKTAQRYRLTARMAKLRREVFDGEVPF